MGLERGSSALISPYNKTQAQGGGSFIHTTQSMQSFRGLVRFKAPIVSLMAVYLKGGALLVNREKQSSVTSPQNIKHGSR